MTGAERPGATPRFFVHVTSVFCTRYPVKLYTLPRFFVHIPGRAQMPEKADKIRVFGAFLRADFFAVGTVCIVSTVAALPACLRQRDNALIPGRKADKMKMRPDLQPAAIGKEGGRWTGGEPCPPIIPDAEGGGKHERTRTAGQVQRRSAGNP